MSEIKLTNTSNTLWNDSQKPIAFAEQIKQQLINWAEYTHVTEELGQNRPDTQNLLNNLFLSVYEKFLTFLNDADATSSAINTWKEIERFLADYTDTGTLKEIVDQLNSNIESRLSVVLENSTGSSTTNGMSQKAITDALDAKQDTITDLGAIRSGVAKVGYYECDSLGNSAAKTISADNYVLSTGGSIKIKMVDANTTDNATLNINNTGAKALYYAGERASSSNSWEAGETVEVYYDGTNFYANNVAGGSGSGDGAFDVSAKYPTSGVEGGNTYTLAGALAVLNANLSASKKKGGMSIKFIQSSDNKYVQYRYMGTETTGNPNPFLDTDNWTSGDGEFSTGEKVSEIGIDSEPTADSKNLVESGGAFNTHFAYHTKEISLLTDDYIVEEGVGYYSDSSLIPNSDSNFKHWKIDISGLVGKKIILNISSDGYNAISFTDNSVIRLIQKVFIVPQNAQYLYFSNAKHVLPHAGVKCYYNEQDIPSDLKEQIDKVENTADGFLKVHNQTINPHNIDDFISNWGIYPASGSPVVFGMPAYELQYNGFVTVHIKPVDLILSYIIEFNRKERKILNVYSWTPTEKCENIIKLPFKVTKGSIILSSNVGCNTVSDSGVGMYISLAEAPAVNQIIPANLIKTIGQRYQFYLELEYSEVEENLEEINEEIATYDLVEDGDNFVSLTKDNVPILPKLVSKNYIVDKTISLLDAESTVSKKGYYTIANNVLTYYDNANYWCFVVDVTDYAGKYLHITADAYKIFWYNSETLLKNVSNYPFNNHVILLPENVTTMYISVNIAGKDSVSLTYTVDGFKSVQDNRYNALQQVNTENLGIEEAEIDIPIRDFLTPWAEYNVQDGIYKMFTNLDYAITRSCYVDVVMIPAALKQTYIVEYANNKIINLYSFTPTKTDVQTIHLPFKITKGSRIYVTNVGSSTQYSGHNAYYIQKSGIPAIGDENLESHSLPTIAIQYKLKVRYCGINDTTDNLDKRVVYLESKEAALKNKKWAIIGDSRSAWMYNETPYYALIAQYLGGFTLNKTNKEILNSLGQVQFDAKGTNGSYVTRFIYQNEGQNPALLDRITITPDIISVYMGTNDFLMGVKLGTIEDDESDYPTNPHTYYGTLRQAILHIYAKFPNAMVVFMSPAASKGYSTAPDSNVPNSDGHVLADYVQAMKEVCGEYSIPVVDIFHDGDYTPFIESQRLLYYQDGLHETTLAHKRIANLLMPVLNNMLSID